MGVIIDITTHTGIGNGNFINDMRVLLTSHARYITVPHFRLKSNEVPYQALQKKQEVQSNCYRCFDKQDSLWPSVMITLRPCWCKVKLN